MKLLWSLEKLSVKIDWWKQIGKKKHGFQNRQISWLKLCQNGD